ncbi:AMP-binding protein [Micromonospora sp. HK10]|uniref:AMP-binding protein n=1 Tax=Micromonospora sp. HK10 TaxID=1538294 RepID=UPI00069795AF|nr:AMP-binding protein [Micromonospora sp. HK10]
MLAGLDADDRGLTFVGTTGEQYVPFTQLAARTAELAARCAGLGLRHGDRVILVLDDPAEFVPAILALLRAGIVAVPYLPPFVLSQQETYGTGLGRVCRAAGARLALLGAAARRVVGESDVDCPVIDFAGLTAAPVGAVGEVDPADPALIQFTSGSTGAPKGVVVSHRALVGHGRALAAGLGIDGTVDRGVSWLPLFHDMGLIGKVFAAVQTQTPVWYVTPQRFVRDPIGFLRLISRVRGTIVFAPNFAFGLLARRAAAEPPEGLDLSSWRIAGCGAEPIRAQTLRAFAEAYAPAGFRAAQLVPSYGLAECTLAVCATRPGEGMRTLRLDADRFATEHRAVEGSTMELVSSGPPLPGVQVRIVGKNGAGLPDGHEGEIAVRCPYLADGYFGDRAATARTWHDGWMHTGDTGFLHEGELYVTGRIKDVVIINGRNYQPHDIELLAERVDGVRPGGVIAFGTSRDDTEAVHVLVEAVRYPPAAGLTEAIATAVRSGLRIPVDDVTVVRRGALPRTSSGKARRRHAAQLLREGRLAVVAPAATPPGRDS